MTRAYSQTDTKHVKPLSKRIEPTFPHSLSRTQPVRFFAAAQNDNTNSLIITNLPAPAVGTGGARMGCGGACAVLLPPLSEWPAQALSCSPPPDKCLAPTVELRVERLGWCLPASCYHPIPSLRIHHSLNHLPTLVYCTGDRKDRPAARGHPCFAPVLDPRGCPVAGNPSHPLSPIFSLIRNPTRGTGYFWLSRNYVRFFSAYKIAPGTFF